MNKIKKFKSFLENLKGNNQDKLINTVEQGFNSCFENTAYPEVQERSTTNKEVWSDEELDREIASTYNSEIHGLKEKEGYKALYFKDKLIPIFVAMRNDTGVWDVIHNI